MPDTQYGFSKIFADYMNIHNVTYFIIIKSKSKWVAFNFIFLIYKKKTYEGSSNYKNTRDIFKYLNKTPNFHKGKSSVMPSSSRNNQHEHLMIKPPDFFFCVCICFNIFTLPFCFSTISDIFSGKNLKCIHHFLMNYLDF